jgi:hypothetical protein
MARMKGFCTEHAVCRAGGKAMKMRIFITMILEMGMLYLLYSMAMEANK